MFNNTLEVCAFVAAFVPTLFAFFGESFQTNTIYRFFSQDIPGAPSSWVFGVAWGTIYPLISVAFFFLITDDVRRFETWIILAMVQFILLLLWPKIFTGMLNFTAALVILLGAWGIGIYLAIVAFIDSMFFFAVAQTILTVWLTFAAYLNVQALKFNKIVRDATACRAKTDDAFDRECINNVRCQDW